MDKDTILSSENGATLKTYDFKDLPIVGITAKVNPLDPTKTVPGQEIKLGGYSGLRYEGLAANGNLKFIANTDRGPNLGANYPLPAFQPEIDRFELNKATGKITLTERIGLTRPDGKPLTGIANLQGGAQNGLSGLAYTDDPALDLFGNKVKNDPLGGDFEGLEVAKDGTFWLVDEYRPSIYHFDAKGKMIDRFIPQGTPTADASFGTAVLPEIYAQRRVNRGFEGLAIEGTKLYAFMQSAIDAPDTADDAASKAGSNLRILEFDTVKKAVTGEYIYRLDDVKVADKIGDAVSLGNGKFAVVERDSLATDKSFKNIYEIDISKATNVYDPKATAGSKSIEEIFKATPTAATPVTKKLIANATVLGYTGVEKLEGLALVDNNTLALINDNDFDLATAKADGKGALTGITPAPTKLGLLTFTNPLVEAKKPVLPAPVEVVAGTTKDDLNLIPTDKQTIFADGGNDIIDGGIAKGSDNRLYGGDGNDELYAKLRDRLFGEAGDDILDASQGKGSNRLYGGAGSDKLFAGTNDLLDGGDGTDTIFAGKGGNTLYGGGGADKFYLAAGSLPTSVNTISDFEIGIDSLVILGIAGATDFSKVTLTQQGTDTLINAGGKDLSVLTGIQSNTLTSSSFKFA